MQKETTIKKLVKRGRPSTKTDIAVVDTVDEVNVETPKEVMAAKPVEKKREEEGFSGKVLSVGNPVTHIKMLNFRPNFPGAGIVSVPCHDTSIAVGDLVNVIVRKG